ncbi:MAG TPA: hypothetical protein VGR57_04945 [Ktedonobacterales bacterium]|nr:hypothetical protein [Ktedonobacterales bacterium]
MMPSVETRELRGQPISHQGQQVTPIARVTRVAWRGGSLDWYRPAAIAVRDARGERRLPIYNVTRLAIGTIVLAGLSAALGAAWLARVSLSGRNGR